MAYAVPSIVAIISRQIVSFGREEKSMFDWIPQFNRFSLSPDNVPAAEKTQSELHKLFYSNAGTLVHKWRNYLKIYENHLSRFRNTPFHMLEIGVAQGGSL